MDFILLILIDGDDNAVRALDRALERICAINHGNSTA